MASSCPCGDGMTRFPAGYIDYCPIADLRLSISLRELSKMTGLRHWSSDTLVTRGIDSPSKISLAFDHHDERIRDRKPRRPAERFVYPCYCRHRLRRDHHHRRREHDAFRQSRNREDLRLFPCRTPGTIFDDADA